MATRARRIRAVLFHSLAHCERVCIPVIFKRRNIWRRGRGWRAEKILEQPLATKRRSRPRGIRGDHENASLAQKSLPILVLQCHAPKVASADVGNTIMLGE